MSDANRCLTSIILVTCNRLEYTKQCVESIRRHTERGSYELIIVDNGSTDDTVIWAKEESDIKVIDNHDEAALPKRCNQALSAASGELLMLLHNDMIAAPSWLDGLKRCLFSDKQIGAVSPVTNSTSCWMPIPVTYKTIEEMELFASALHAIPDKTKWEERVKLSGYCLLLRREAWEQAGPLDERYNIGCFVEGDYGMRLRLAGYKSMLCGDVFIHQNENVSVHSDAEVHLQNLQRNKELFMNKWGFFPSEGMHIRMDISTAIQRQTYEYKHTNCSIMEIGCGCGATIVHVKQQFPTAKWYGVESRKWAAKVAEANGITVFQSSEPDDWTLPADGVDGLMIGDAYPYDTPEAMKRLVSLLKPGGWLIGSFEAQQQTVIPYTVQQLHQLYAQAGFSYVKVTHALMEQLSFGTMSDEPIADCLLAFGRTATSESEQERETS